MANWWQLSGRFDCRCCDCHSGTTFHGIIEDHFYRERDLDRIQADQPCRCLRIGLAFAFGWTPVSPILAAILFVAGSDD